MKKIMVIIMFLGLATTAFARGRGNRGGGGERGNSGGGRAYNGGGYGGGYNARGYGRRSYYGGGFRGGYRQGGDYDRYDYRGYAYRRYGYRPVVGFGYYSSPWAYGPGYYRPYCDPAWGPCYYPPPYAYYGRPGISIGIGLGRGGVVIGREGRRFGRR